MDYIIEYKGGQRWVRSDCWPGVYSEAEAQDIIDRSPGWPYRMTPLQSKPEPKTYMIELLCGDKQWERSWSYPLLYTKAEAQDILANHNARFTWRIVPEGGMPVKRKKYRRHAAVTPLELRGAKAMLESALGHVVQQARASKYGPCDVNYPNPFMILTDAKLAVIRQLEKM
jgi:hypothetical protein